MPSKINLRIQTIVQKETSNIAFTTYAIDAISLAAWLTAWGNFKTATDSIILGVQQHENISIYDTALSGAMPVDNFARRENKLLVRYTVTVTGKKHRMEIPCPDNTALTFETGDANFVNITAEPMLAWVTEFENLARSPDNGTDVITVDSVQYVGRNI